MRRFVAGVIAFVFCAPLPVRADSDMYWLNYSGAAPFPPAAWTPVSPQSPLPVVGSPSGTSYTWLNDIKATTSIATAASVSSLINASATYCVFQPINGVAYGTYDGSTPSSTNYDVYLQQNIFYSVSGFSSLGKLQLQGTNLAGNCWK